MKKIDWVSLLFMILIAELTGLLGNFLSGNTRMLYLSLSKPPLAPPGWLFAVVWPILYLFMGLAYYFVNEDKSEPMNGRAMCFYWLQLLVNLLWPVIFFRFELYFFAVIVILLLDVLVAITTVLFFKVKILSGYLLIPYLLWISFATYLNIGFALLN